MFLVLRNILIMQKHKVPNIESHKTAFIVYGKGELVTVRSAFSFQVLSMNDIKSPLLQGVTKAGVDVLI